jgi:hypothetical protein
MGTRVYYTLISSLPPLPRFDQAERLPITRERLQERGGMLEPEDAELLERAAAFLAWQRQPAARTDQNMVADFQRMADLIDHPTIWALFEFPINQRTVMAALRRRHRGLPAPAAGEPWGVGPLVRHVEKNWDDSNFKLGAMYPWISQAREYLQAGEAVALERLLKNLLWDRVDRSIQPYDFGFEAVLAYLLKWDIVQQWLSYDVEAAKARFEELVVEVTSEAERFLD